MGARLVKRGDIFYCWIPIAEGGTRRVSTHCTDRKAAEARAGELERDAVDPVRAAKNTTTIQRVLDDYESSRKRLHRSEGTLHHVKTKAGHALRFFHQIEGTALARDVTHLSLVRFIERRQAEGARDTTIKKELRVLGAAWKLARRNGLVDRGVDEIMPELADDYEPGKRSLSLEEIFELALVLPPGRAAVVCFAVAVGCDPGALWRVQPDDIAVDFATCRVRGTKRKTRDRIVPLPLPIQRSLLRWAVANADGAIEGRLFTVWTNMRRDLHEACGALGFAGCSPNDLRRTYGGWLRGVGIEPQLIGAAMGHADSRMVERVYGRLPADTLAKLLRQRLEGTSDGDTNAAEAKALTSSPADSKPDPTPETPPTGGGLMDGAGGESERNASPKASEGSVFAAKNAVNGGAQRRNRTADTGIFNPSNDPVNDREKSHFSADGGGHLDRHSAPVLPGRTRIEVDGRIVAEATHEADSVPGESPCQETVDGLTNRLVASVLPSSPVGLAKAGEGRVRVTVRARRPGGAR